MSPPSRRKMIPGENLDQCKGMKIPGYVNNMDTELLFLFKSFKIIIV